MIVEMLRKWLLGYENKQQRLKLRHYHFTGITFYYQMTSNKIMRDQTMLLFMFNNICDFLDRNYCKNKNTIFYGMLLFFK